MTIDSVKQICNPCLIVCRSLTRRRAIRKHSKDSSRNERSERRKGRSEQAAKTNGVVVYVGVDRYAVSLSKEERRKQTWETSEDERISVSK